MFAIDDAWVLRRLRGGGDTAAQAALLDHLARHGYPVPAVHPGALAEQAPEPDARGTLVLRRQSGPTMTQALLDGGMAAETAGPVLAGLLRRLHAVPARLAAAPGARILHLDLHPGNVMLTPRGPAVIDWDNAAEGPPGLDLAMSALILAQVAVDPAAGAAAAARVVLTAMLAALAAAGADDPLAHLPRARAARAADPAVTARELGLLDEAVALTGALARR